MIHNKGLASFSMETKPSRMVIGVSLLLMALATYALVIECFEQPVWLVAHVPGLNSVAYRGAMALATGLQFGTALYFLYSSGRAHAFLATADADLSNSKKAILRALMGRVAASGGIIILITLFLFVGLSLVFNPTGYVIVLVAQFVLQISNSWLQVRGSQIQSEKPRI